MDIKKMNVEELLPANYNPRKDLKEGDEEFEKLKKSIENFGYVDPVIWNKRTDTVVGGHQRLKALKSLGYEEVDVSVVDLSLEEEKALNIALNKIEGGWDEPKLKDLLEDLESSGFDINLTGFDLEEMEAITENIEIGDFLEEEEERKRKEKLGEIENSYTNKIETPNYEPSKEDKPEIERLYKTEKADDLFHKIEKSSISKEEKDFLKAAASRHIVFDYRNIAEYYAHADKEVQELMEESALVIIDFNSALKNGYIEFNEAVIESLEDLGEENDDDDE